MNYISPANHPESNLSGSTVEAMIDRTKELGLNYFAITDNGHLSSILKGHMYGEKNGIKIIAGIELFFKDNNCEIIKNTPSEKIKYFKIIVHAKDQEAYQKIVRMCSDQKRKKVRVLDSQYGLFTWKDLEDLAQSNITITTSNIECMVSKHLLVGREDLSLKYYEKLRNLVKPENFYPSIVPYKQDKYWNTVVRVNLGGKIVTIPAQDDLQTDQYKRAKAVELTRRGNRHSKIECVFIDKIKFKVVEKYQEIKSAKLENAFQDLPRFVFLGGIHWKNWVWLNFPKFIDLNRRYSLVF